MKSSPAQVGNPAGGGGLGAKRDEKASVEHAECDIIRQAGGGAEGAGSPGLRWRASPEPGVQRRDPGPWLGCRAVRTVEPQGARVGRVGPRGAPAAGGQEKGSAKQTRRARTARAVGRTRGGTSEGLCWRPDGPGEMGLGNWALGRGPAGPGRLGQTWANATSAGGCGSKPRWCGFGERGGREGSQMPVAGASSGELPAEGAG